MLRDLLRAQNARVASPKAQVSVVVFLIRQSAKTPHTRLWRIGVLDGVLGLVVVVA